MTIPTVLASIAATPVSSANITVPYPAGYSNGDGILVAVAASGDGVLNATPAGWTLLKTGAYSYYTTLTLIFKVIDGTDGTGVTLQFSKANRKAGASLRTDATDSDDIADWNTGNGATIDHIDVTTLGADRLVIRTLSSGIIGTSTSITEFEPGGTVEIESISSSGSNEAYIGIGTEDLALEGATGTSGATQSNTERLIASTVALFITPGSSFNASWASNANTMIQG